MLSHHQQVLFLLKIDHLRFDRIDFSLDLLRLSIGYFSLVLHVLDPTLYVLHLLTVLCL